MWSYRLPTFEAIRGVTPERLPLLDNIDFLPRDLLIKKYDFQTNHQLNLDLPVCNEISYQIALCNFLDHTL